MSGTLSSNGPPETYAVCRAKGFSDGEQRSTMVDKLCLSEEILDVYDHGSGTVG